MSLSLRESCTLYERYCRQHKDVPTFEAFNSAHYTCLPNHPTAYARFHASVTAARRAEGLPIRRKLFSLYKSLNGGIAPAAVPPRPQAVVDTKRLQKACPVTVPSLTRAVSLKTRPPAPPAAVPDEPMTTSEMDESDAPELAEWTVAAYREAVAASTHAKLKDKANNMVHFVPVARGESLASLACKLTKSTWETLSGKSDAPLKMRDGTKRAMESIEMDTDDFAELRRQRKAKLSGPYFIRVSSI